MWHNIPEQRVIRQYRECALRLCNGRMAAIGTIADLLDNKKELLELRLREAVVPGPSPLARVAVSLSRCHRESMSHCGK